MTEKETPKTVEVLLLKEHTHGGQKYPANTVITVRVADVPFLEEHKLIDPQKTAPVGTAAKAAAEAQEKSRKEVEARFADLGNGGTDQKGKENK